jgi:hypothetical protein
MINIIIKRERDRITLSRLLLLLLRLRKEQIEKKEKQPTLGYKGGVHRTLYRVEGGKHIEGIVGGRRNG